MAAIVTTAGKIRILELLTQDMQYVGFGRPLGVDQLDPPPEDPATTEITDIIGYAKINTRGWLIQDAGGPILADGIKYSVSSTPTTIAYVEALIPSGVAEGVSNGIGQIGVVGEDVLVDDESAQFQTVSEILSTGTLFRIQHIPVYIRPPNTSSNFIIIMPLLA